MHLLYTALQKTQGTAGGDALVAAMKGAAFESPRGPVVIDANTRDVVQNVYIRRVEKVNGQMFNVEFATSKGVADPGKAR
jgi:branched-chain amino acid transport system substrate-binding protein